MPTVPRSSRVAFFAAVSCLAASSLEATSVLLSNDGFPAGGVVYQAVFLSDEMAGSTLGPVTATSFLDRIELLYGPADAPDSVTVHVYLDGGSAVPGTEIYFTSVVLAPSDSGVLKIELAGQGVTVPAGNIRIAIEFGHNGLPCVARDSDGTIQTGRNWIYSNGLWFSSESAGLAGDWVIRAVITLPPELFTDGFESSEYARWSTAVPGG